MTEIPLPPLSVLDVCGADAAIILNNLTTNDVRALPDPVATGDAGYQCLGLETFVTDVRGRCIGHVVAYRMHDRYRLIGAQGQSEAICSHVDRYTIREDANVVQHGANYVAKLIHREGNGESTAEAANQELPPHTLLGIAHNGNHVQLQVPWLSQVNKSEQADRNAQWFLDLRIDSDASTENSEASTERDETDDAGSSFHQHRIAAGFPWHGIDFSEANLPQEIDRDANAISFTKGCYLGQETVARLDALGQVQKKLVRWEIHNVPRSVMPAPDQRLYPSPEDAERAAAGEKTKPVGRLTSVASSPLFEDSAPRFALGMARRSHFDAGAIAHGVLPSGEFFSGVVR